MLKKIGMQTAFTVIIVCAVLLSKNIGIESLSNGVDVIMHHATLSYTIDDIRYAASKTKDAFTYINGSVGGAVNTFTGKPIYGEPIDETYQGDRAVVYAVAGGRVLDTGENEEIGKYIKIVHGNQAVSMYGNLQSIKVDPPENVKKGQIIGIYKKQEDKDFYYSFEEFD